MITIIITLTLYEATDYVVTSFMPQFGTIFLQTFEALTSRVNSLSVALRASYLSVRTAEGASEKQSSLKARLINGLTYLLTYLLTKLVCMKLCV